MAAGLLLGRLFSAHYPQAATGATLACVSVWLLIAATNFWVGVSRAGYSAAEELPVFLLIFAVPAAAAILIKWRFL